MRYIVWAGLLATASTHAADGSAPNYYDIQPQTSSRSTRPSEPVQAAPAQVKRKTYIVDSHESASGTAGAAISTQPGKTQSIDSSSASSQTILPPNMERGVKDLEEGMEELSQYTGVMAGHIQKNGMRGFLAMPKEIKDQGSEVGKKIGNGISGIATDTAREMVANEKQ